ncbi:MULTISPECIES: hypothetical protein [Xanthomonas]|uniref:Uncharacterized protein n=1 Tax=Xanthomonas campestris pv. papavericola TaxID=487881 RepID=A0AAJ3CG13_XANCA|nr:MULTISPECIES: hypothetical protein [Xanthomonas]MEA9787119.1 hypothetical protein [Xanthomonas campestris pv. raphani]MEA9828673.1 hypothetical protein [Xanthomonas campestris pv. raphani]MEC3889745.1 hypothetical protein [Xanthomonas campestris pv. papavericola]
MLEKIIKVGDDASWLPREEGGQTGSGGLIELTTPREVEFAAKYLPFIPNAISAVSSGGLDVISYNFSGCLMAVYNAQDGRRMVCHVSTGDGQDCRNAWSQIRSTSTHVFQFRPSEHIETKGSALAGCYGLITNDLQSLAITVVVGRDGRSRSISAIKKMRLWQD